MKILHTAKDGGPESNVTGYWLIEAKRLCSIALLRFADGSRETFHSHAFDAISWVLRGRLREQHVDGRVDHHTPSVRPIVTERSTMHRVFSHGTTWVLTFRGPWRSFWHEHDWSTGEIVRLGHGRRVLSRWGGR